MSIRKTLPYTFGGGSGPDPDAELYLTNAAITTPSYQTAIRTLVSYLKTNGLWTRAKIFYPFLTDYYNELTYTEDLTNSVWTKTALTTSVVAVTNPIGGANCSSIIPTAASSLHQALYQTNNNSITANCCFSIYVKSNGYDWVRLVVTTAGANFFFKQYWFNTATGLFGTINGGATNVSNSATDMGNGWWRIQVTAQSSDTGTGTGASVLVASQTADAETTFTGNGTSGLYVWGAQFESYVSTASAYQAITGASPQPDQMKYNLRDARDLDAAFRITWNGRVSFTQRGAGTYGGTGAYGDTFLIANTDLLQNDVNISTYLIDNRTGSNRFDLGTFDGAGSLSMAVGYSGTTEFRTRVNSATASTSVTVTNSQGFWSANRLSSTIQTKYKNGVQVDSESISSDGLSLEKFPVLAVRELGTVGNTSTPRRSAFIVVGSGYTQAEQALLYTGIQAFQTSIGRQV